LGDEAWGEVVMERSVMIEQCERRRSHRRSLRFPTFANTACRSAARCRNLNNLKFQEFRPIIGVFALLTKETLVITDSTDPRRSFDREEGISYVTLMIAPLTVDLRGEMAPSLLK
jgi:hypothetical protein